MRRDRRSTYRKCYNKILHSRVYSHGSRQCIYVLTHDLPFKYPGRDSSVGRAVDCHATGPGFNTHSKPGWGLTQPSIPLWVGKMGTSKNIG